MGYAVKHTHIVLMTSWLTEYPMENQCPQAYDAPCAEPISSAKFNNLSRPKG